jgi:hypothetical protein
VNTLKVRAGAAFKQIFNSKKDVERDFGSKSVINYIFVFRQNTRFTSMRRYFIGKQRLMTEIRIYSFQGL